MPAPRKPGVVEKRRERARGAAARVDVAEREDDGEEGEEARDPGPQEGRLLLEARVRPRLVAVDAPLERVDARVALGDARLERRRRRVDVRLGGTRVIQRCFNVGVPRARVPG